MTKIVEEIWYMGRMPFTTTYKYEFNDDGKPVKKSKGDEIWLYKYDRTGYLIEEKWLYVSSDLPDQYFKDSYNYNVKGQRVKMVRQLPDNSVFFAFNYQYDLYGNMTKQFRK